MIGPDQSATVGVGVVGAGLIGEKRIRACGHGSSAVAVFDLDLARATSLASSVGARACASLDELLQMPEVDLVVVATTHDQLTPIGLRAVEAGKHVLLEKPAGISAARLRELSAAAAARGVQVRVGYNHRFHPSLLRMREVVQSGQYGRLLWIRGRYGHGGRPGYEREWRADAAVSGGGEMVDQGSHLIDLVRSLVGDVELAFAELPTLFWPMPVEDNAFFALRPATGGFAWLHTSWSEWKNTFSFELTLERAKLEITGLGGSYGVERLTLFEMSPEMGPPFTTSWEWPFPDRSWHLEMDDVLSAIAGGTPIGASLADAAAVLDIIEKAYE
jgi:predicted dehydrogenase